MDFQSILVARRDAKKHTLADLRALANGAADGSIPDYQLAAWLMAAYLNPLDLEETAWLTQSMADSGERVDLTGLPKPWVDKHSTGGVGDKTTIVVLPLLASCGLTIVKMSGRGLGITGGTVDKLSSIPGFRLNLSPDEMKEQAKKIGLALTGQTPDLAPADKVLYALRDTTATVSSAPLIVSSILSKKLAGGAETVMLDVKCGSGAFMRTLEDARNLSEILALTAALCRLNVRIALSDMSQPLGSAVGNALEVREAIRVLGGEESRFSELCIELAAHTLVACGLQASRESSMKVAREAISSGAAKRKAKQWFDAQGATVDVIANPNALPTASVVKELTHTGNSGWVASIDAETVGHAVVSLGGGRQKKADKIDPSVGVELHVEVGSEVQISSPLLTIHAANQESAEAAMSTLAGALTFSCTKIEKTSALLDIL